MRTRFDELHLVLIADPFYGAGEPQTVTTTEKNAQGHDVEVTITRESPPEQQYPFTKILIAKIYSETAGHQFFQQFRQRWNCLPCKNDTVRHLVYLWCGLMELPTYWKNGSRTGWEREDFLNNWQETEFIIELNELEAFLNEHKLPLPISLYPNALYNTLLAIDNTNEDFDKFQPFSNECLPDEEHYPIGSWNTVKSGRSCKGDERDYLPLFTAIKLVTTGDENANRLNADGLGLVSKARREHSKWDVRECWTRPISETIHFVHLGDFIKWAWDCGIQAPDQVIKTWLRESDSDEDTAVRLHILFRIAGYDNTAIEAIPKKLRPLDARQWNRIETLANTRAHFILRETKGYNEFKNKEKELNALDADIEATTGIRLTARKEGTIVVEGAERRHQTEDTFKTRQNIKNQTLVSSAASDSPLPFVPYPKALKLLTDRLAATQDEMAAWVWAGPENGGLAAYLNANELDPPPRFYYGAGNGQDFDYLAPLMACWFHADDIANFQPSDRYITGKALIARWE